MFNYDGPLMRILNRITDIIILNFFTLICCIPIITIGASITAAHYTALKMHRDTDNYVLRNFFRSFKTNFVQATLIWLIWLVFVGMSLFSFFAYGGSTFHSILKGVMLAVLLLVSMGTMWLFALQARFTNPIGRTIRNAFLMAIKHLFRTFGMLLVVLVSAFVWLLGSLNLQLFWVVLLFGFSVPIYVCAMIYNKPFLQLEEAVKKRLAEENPEEALNEDEVIMHDESKFILSKEDEE
ncbi:MAG: YesL family protein [Faecalimonas sp.]|nr:YesL family protein [Faecalimonas sp.]